ncbi:hypothetical protein [Pseudolysinimonas sp.]|jgi:hypothetical protein|uniref:hypothetical protein n=1 Tax=Pseudolysinimonas sp. TaxID=2680009 RepID=UPI00378464C3
MTIPQQNPFADASAETSATRGRSVNSLAGAIAVFLGGYLLLAGFAGFLGQTALSVFATIGGRPAPAYPFPLLALEFLQFLFAIVVVVGGLVLGRRSTTGTVLGVGVVIIGSLLTFAFLGLRLNGMLPIPGGRDGIPFTAVFVNSWFAIVFFVGVAWLLTRAARLGWVAILGTLILIPLPMAFLLANVDSGVIQIVMFLLSGIVGAAIIIAGRPLEDRTVG